MVFSHNGASIYYEIQGEGKPLLLLHGWMGNADSFLPLARDMKESRKVIAVDFPGQGNRSPEPPEAWSVTEYMELTAALLAHIGVMQTDVVAHSFGGRVTILFASKYPDLVDKIVITGGAGLLPQRTKKKKWRGTMYRMLRGLIQLRPAQAILGAERIAKMREALVQKYGSPDYRVLSPAMRATFSRVIAQDLRPHLPDISAPTLLIWGREDTETPLWMGEVMQSEIPDAGLVVLEQAGHFAYLEKYADFYAIVRNFFGE